MKKTLFYITLALLSLAACSDSETLMESIADISPSEQNGGGEFLWTRAEDKENYAQFLRNFGVGYSYDAVNGSYCDWKDIRCQVFNRYFIENFSESVGESLLHTNQTKFSSVSYNYSYSKRDYVANVGMETNQKIDIGLYSNEKRKRTYFIEDGVQEKFVIQLNETHYMAQRFISAGSLLELYYKKPDVLTLSFRNAIDHLAETMDYDIAAVDSFVNVWGTHVITSADLGATIDVDLMNDMWRYQDQASKEEFSTEQFLLAVQANSTHSTSDDYKWIEKSKLNINAKGGDQSTLKDLLGEHRADGSRSFSIDGISAWRQSIFYDPDDERASNVELIGMKIIPIWDVANAIDPIVARRIKAVITQDAALQQSLMGVANFFNGKFPIRHLTAQCKYHKDDGWDTYSRTDSKSDPMIVNIESGGRYVATICHETLDGKDMWVCYPIYGGKVNLACGLGIDNDNKAYKVRILKSKITVTPTNETASDTLYINDGAVSVSAIDGIKYAQCNVLPYVEMAGGVQPDGSYSSTIYTVKKDGGTFYIETPDDVKNFVSYKKDKNGRYIRDTTYTYIYNPNEFKL